MDNTFLRKTAMSKSLLPLLLVTSSLYSPVLAATSQESREAFEIMRNSGLSPNKELSKVQQEQLEEKIIETLKKLFSLERKKGDFLFPKEAVTKRLKKATSFNEALAILDNIPKEATPGSTVNVTQVEQKLQEQKNQTQASMTEQQIDQDTDRVMKESFIATNTAITEAGKKAVREKIHAIIEKYHKKEIPNLTGQDPVKSLTDLLTSPKSRGDVEERLNKFNQEIQNYSEKYVAHGKELNKNALTTAPIISQVNIEDALLIGNPSKVDSQIAEFQSKGSDARLVSKFKNNSEKITALKTLVSSNNSGFVAATLAQNENNAEVIMKLFTLENTRDKNMIIRSNVKNVYYKFFSFPRDVDKLNGFQSQGYNFWYLNNSFFAIPKNNSLPILSLSNRKSTFKGSTVVDLLKAVSAMK